MQIIKQSHLATGLFLITLFSSCWASEDGPFSSDTRSRERVKWNQATANDPQEKSVLTTLYRFDSDNRGAYWPEGKLVLKDGYLYGITAYGGEKGRGAIFKMNTRNNSFELINQFTAPYGGSPSTGLILGKDGYLYGTTTWGPAIDYTTSYIYRIHPASYVLEPLHLYYKAEASGNLTMGNDGHVYGITERGGYDDNGAIFRLNLSGDRSYKELHSFASSESGVYNGAKPNASPVFGNDGYIYGTTTDGGYSNSAPGADKTTGTIYRMHLASGSFQVLFRYAHSGVKFGSIPVAGLVLGKDGYFYGATSDGGAHDSGTVFKIKVTQGNSVTYQVLHSFNDTDGSRPTRSLTVGKDGHLYGVTPWGGAYDCGTIYKINGENGSHTLLHSFNCTDGNAPSTELVMDDDGSFYGMTAGQSGFGGTAYRYIPIGR